MEPKHHRPYRSLFWPVILIGIGLIWLLGSIANIAQISVPVLFRLWPLLLIFVGLDILLGRRSPAVGAALGVAAIIIVVGFSVGGRMLGLSTDVTVRTETLREPLDGTQTASVVLAFSDSPVELTGLAGGSDLISASLTYVGTIDFRVSGSENKSVHLSRNEADFLLFNPLYWDPSLNWRIGLSSQIPLDLTLVGGSGESQVDLHGLQLKELRISMGSGLSHFTAPENGTAEVASGSGAMEWSILQGTALSIELKAGSGAVHFSLPATPAVRIEVEDTGSGKVNIPAGWAEVASGDDGKGVWESPGYGQATRRVLIVVKRVGSGNVIFQ